MRKRLCQIYSSILFIMFQPSVAGAESNQVNENCTEAVIVIRHAEDTASGPHALTTAGLRHADLYANFFQKNFFSDYKIIRDDQTNLCPIKRIITVDPKYTPNPLSTITPFAKTVGISDIEYFGNEWHTVDRLKLLSQNQSASPQKSSTLISWTRQGLWGNDRDNLSDSALLAKLTANDNDLYKIKNGKSPMHDNVYIFLNQDKDTGKFNEVHLYHQAYKSDKDNDNYTCYHRLNPNWGSEHIFEPIKMEKLNYDDCKWGS